MPIRKLRSTRYLIKALGIALLIHTAALADKRGDEPPQLEEPIKTLLVEGGLDCVSYSADGTTLLCANGRSIERWTVATWEQSQSNIGNIYASARLFVEGGKFVVTEGGHPSSADVWETATGKHLLSIPTSANPVAVSTDSRLLVTRGANPYDIGVYSLLNGRAVPFSVRGAAMPIAFSPDATTMLAWHQVEHRIMTINLSTGGVTGALPQVMNLAGGHLAYSPDGSLLVAATVAVQPRIVLKGRQRVQVQGYMTQLAVWRTSGKFLGTMSAWQGTDTLTAIKFSPNSRLLAVMLGSRISIWDLQKQKIAWTIQRRASAFAAGGRAFVPIAFSPDNKHVAAGFTFLKDRQRTPDGILGKPTGEVCVYELPR